MVDAPDSFSLNLDGDVELGGYVFKDGVPFIHNYGGAAYVNTAVGLNALFSTTPGNPSSNSGTDNSAFGARALRDNTSGSDNTAVGSRALQYNTEGRLNTAVGQNALGDNDTGNYNTAIGNGSLGTNDEGNNNTAGGFRALLANRGDSNTAFGYLALHFNSTGSSNTAIGALAGYDWGLGSNNIAVGAGADGESGDSGVIRIGGGGLQTETFIEGISNAAIAGVAVMISGDQLGVAPSSARFKQDIGNLEGVKDRPLALRPVSFRYKDELVSGAGVAENPIEYGLVAEEVAKVFPDLVVNDEGGEPYTVRYHLLTPIMLSEIQRQEGEIEQLRRQMADRDRVVEELRRRLEELAAKPSLDPGYATDQTAVIGIREIPRLRPAAVARDDSSLGLSNPQGLVSLGCTHGLFNTRRPQHPH